MPHFYIILAIYRADHGLQDLREKVFPIEVKSTKTTKYVPLNTLPRPTKRKKNSPSSLKNNARRAKADARNVITPQEPKLPAPEPNVVAEVKREGKPREVEILDEVPTIQSARRAKAAARRKFILIESTPTCQPDKDKVTGDEKKDDDELPQIETSSETSKTRIQVKETLANIISSLLSSLFV